MFDDFWLELEGWFLTQTFKILLDECFYTICKLSRSFLYKIEKSVFHLIVFIEQQWSLKLNRLKKSLCNFNRLYNVTAIKSDTNILTYIKKTKSKYLVLSAMHISNIWT